MYYIKIIILLVLKLYYSRVIDGVQMHKSSETKHIYSVITDTQRRERNIAEFRKQWQV